MESKLIEKNQANQNKTKKTYTPPKLILYGKLSQLTAGGSGPDPEMVSMAMITRRV